MTGRLPRRVERRNATFQQWQALLTSRAKRTRSGEMLVQGVRPITLAVQAGLDVRALLHDGRRPSSWARDLMAHVPVVTVDPELLAELGQREEAPELVALVAVPDDVLPSLVPGTAPVVVVLDRPAGPGNIGTLARSADALGASALVVAGHAADPWDPQAVRASTGSLFSLPVARVPGAADVLDWVQGQRAAGVPLQVVGTDEDGSVELPDADLTGPLVVVVGSEATGMSAAWREACDVVLRIPMGGTASSLNAASAGTVVLYEAVRQRR